MISSPSSRMLPFGVLTSPMMLFSVVNTKLRDDYASLDALCEDMHVNRRQLEARLKEAGFEYNPAQNKFW